MPDSKPVEAMGEVDPRIHALADELYRRGSAGNRPYEQIEREHQQRWRRQAIVLLTYLDSLLSSGGREQPEMGSSESLNILPGGFLSRLMSGERPEGCTRLDCFALDAAEQISQEQPAELREQLTVADIETILGEAEWLPVSVVNAKLRRMKDQAARDWAAFAAASPDQESDHE